MDVDNCWPVFPLLDLFILTPCSTGEKPLSIDVVERHDRLSIAFDSCGLMYPTGDVYVVGFDLNKVKLIKQI